MAYLKYYMKPHHQLLQAIVKTLFSNKLKKTMFIFNLYSMLFMLHHFCKKILYFETKSLLGLNYKKKIKK
jgi:hypothetical protein